MEAAVSPKMTLGTALRRTLSRPHVGDGAAVVVAMLVIGAPALFTKNGFAYDFTNHLWLVYVQEHAISSHLLPTYFVNAPTNGIFYPVFMFYGGTLYAAAGALAAALGGAVVVAYVAFILLAVASAYGGLLWLARQLGVRSWMAHAPALAYVTSAYYVTNIYGRGSWPEFVACSTLPLLFASGWRLSRAPEIELLPASLFVLSWIFFAGSHNITLLLGGLFVVLLLVALRVSAGREFAVRPQRALAVSALAMLAVLVDAWFLLPDLLHAKDTYAAGIHYTWAETRVFNTLGMLFYPLRQVPHQSTTPGLFVQAPDWFLAWGLLAGGALWSGAAARLRRAGVALTTLLVLVLALILIGPLWDALPRIMHDTQFPYRLNTYVALSIAGLVLVCVLGLERAEPGHRRRLALMLAGAAAVSVALCVWQLFVPTTTVSTSYANRDGVFVSVHKTPHTWYDLNNYADKSQPVVRVSPGQLIINPDQINSDHVTLRIDPPAGRTPFVANFVPGPYAVRVGGGIERAGIAKSGPIALRRVHGGSGPVTLTLAPAGGSVTLGRWLSLFSIVALLLLLVIAVVRRALRR